MISSGRTWAVLLGLAVLCVVLYQFGNGRVALTDPDDVFYADTANEMLRHHSWLVPIMFDQPQWEKPPLYYWLLMMSFAVFGVTATAARLVGVLVAFGAVAGTYFVARRLLGERVGRYGAVILATSVWWMGLARVVLTDLLFSALIMFALYAFLVWYRSGHGRGLLWFGVCTGLATLAKSPLGLALPTLIVVVFLSLRREWPTLKRFLVSYWWLVAAVIGLPWYVYVTARFGNQFVGEFFVHDHWERLIRPEHAEFNTWYFYFGAVAAGFIPWTTFILLAKDSLRAARPVALFLVVWIAVIGLFFEIAQSKLTTYVSPIYPALALLLAIGIVDSQPTRWMRYATAALQVILAAGLVAGAVVIAQRYPQFGSAALTLFGILAGILTIAAVLMALNRVQQAVTVAAASSVAFAIVSALLVFGKLDAGLTQANLPSVVASRAYHDRPILCSKLFVRGVRFYVDNPVAVIANNAQPFWSAHPVPIVSTNAEVREFVRQRDTLLAVLSDGDLERVAKAYGPGARIDTLLSDMEKNVVACYAHPSEDPSRVADTSPQSPMK